MHKIFLCITADFVTGHSVVKSAELLLLLLPLSFVLIVMLTVITTVVDLIGICM
jgi:hypothetical protein